MNISDLSQRYIGIYLIKGRKNMHHEMSNSTTKESFGEEVKYRVNHLNSGTNLVRLISNRRHLWNLIEQHCRVLIFSI